MCKELSSLFLIVMILAPSIPSTFGAKQSQTETPPSIKISNALSIIPSDGLSHPSFFITLTKDESTYIPTTPLNVTISCSDERALNLPKWVIVTSGSYYTLINASSTAPEKMQVEVSATASDFIGSKISIGVEPPTGTPTSLKVTLLPDVLEPKKGSYAEVIVTIVDSYGKPTKARETITVTLTSSNLGYADVEPKFIVIPEGSYSGKGKVISNGFVGSTTISASSSNLKSSSAIAKVSGAIAEKVGAWTPAKILLGETSRVYLAVLDAAGKPVSCNAPVTLTLFSSNSSIIKVTKNATVSRGGWMAYGEISSIAPGSATLYVASEGLTPTSLTVGVIATSGVASALKTYALSGFFPVEDVSQTVLAVQLVDSKGLPVKNDPKTVSIFSASTSILDIQGTVTVGGTNSVSYVTALTRSPGSVKVSAYSGDLIFSQTVLNVVLPITTSISILAPPIPAGETVEACVLSTSSGVPTPLSEDTPVQIVSSNTQVLNVDSPITLSKSSYYKIITIQSGAPGDVTVTVQGSGLPASSSLMKVNEVKPSIFKVLFVQPMNLKEFPVILQTVSTQGSPIICDDPVSVRISSSNTSIINFPSSITIPEGSSDLLLFGDSNQEGDCIITLSSGDFSSLTFAVKNSVFVYGFTLICESQASLGSTVKVVAKTVYNSAPMKDATIYWKGPDIFTNSTVTDEKGESFNFVTIRSPINLVEAEIELPEIGVVTSTKEIQGLKLVKVNVNSTLGIEIEGSGYYITGEKITLDAPPFVELPGYLNILGIRYIFQRWSRDLDSTTEKTEYIVPDSDNEIFIEACYEAEYLGLIVRIGVVMAALLATYMVLKMIRKRSS